MTFGPRKRLAVLGVLVVLAGLGLVVLSGRERLGVVFLGALQAVTLAVVAYAFVELDRRRRRADARLERGLDAAARADDVARSDQLLDLAEQVGRSASIVERLADSVADDAATRRETGEALRRIERSARTITRAIAAEEKRGFAQQEALLALYHELRPEHALPPTRGWAASPDLLLWCWRHVRAVRPETVVECGSGVSTLVLAAACRSNGVGRVVALEHDERYVGTTRALLAEHDLEGWAEVRHAPLERVHGQERPWYRLDRLPDAPFDLVLVDGPPGNQDPLARLPATEVLPPRLAPGGVVVFDDAHREGERTVVERWLEDRPQFTLEEVPHEKGTAVLRRSADAAG